MPHSGVIAALMRCLDQTAQALRTGDFTGLAVLAAELEGLADGLATQAASPSAPELEALRARALGQLRHLSAARDGVRAAMQRVAQLRRLPSELSTYDRDGRGLTFRFATRTLEHRA
jgi:hypothetical protein